MNTIGPLIFLSLAFGLTIALRIVFLLIIRSGETTKSKRTQGPTPTVIPHDLFAANPHENTP